MAAIVRLFVDSQRLIVRSQNRTKCVNYVWLSYPMWPSRWVLCISMQWLRLKGCHVACDEWTSGEICSLQHMWVIGSVMWAAASDESLKFGVQGETATNWFSRVNGARDNGIWLYENSLGDIFTCCNDFDNAFGIHQRNLSVAIVLIYCVYLMLTWLLPGLFSTSGHLTAILAWWWHSRSTEEE